MRVALLNPPSPSGATFQKEVHRCGDRTHAGELWPPTGLATLAALARRAAWDADVFDGMLRPGDVAGFIESVAARAPSLLVVLTSTPTVLDDLAVARAVARRARAPVVAIGTHVSARPAEALARGADAVLVGEPEGPLEALLAADRVDPAAWAGLPGVAVAGAPEPAAPAEAYDLARLPLPARDLLDNARYTMPFTEGRPFATVQVMRGCPYGCSFCRTPAFSGRQTRLRPIDAVVDELRALVALGVRDVAFLADTFTVRREHTVALCDAIADLGLRWYCTTRVDRVDAELCRRMARAGCAAVAFGVESPDAATLARVGKELAAPDAVVRGALRDASAAGLQTLGYFILGLPGEDAASLWATARYARGLPLDHAFFHVATPFPGTALFEECLAQGYLTTTDWRRYEESSMPVIHTGRLAPETVLAARQAAQVAFYAQPARLARELGRTRSLAALGHKLRAAGALLRPAW